MTQTTTGHFLLKYRSALDARIAELERRIDNARANSPEHYVDPQTLWQIAHERNMMRLEREQVEGGIIKFFGSLLCGVSVFDRATISK